MYLLNKTKFRLHTNSVNCVNNYHILSSSSRNLLLLAVALAIHVSQCISMRSFIVLFGLYYSFSALSAWALTQTQTPVVMSEQAHNPQWFTQGLYKEDDGFYISSGKYGRSKLIYQSPSKNLSYSLPSRYFAEGITVVDNLLLLLTWKENTLFIFDKHSFKLLKTVEYSGEGWGLTHSDHFLIMSNGSSVITFRDPETFKVKRTLNLKSLDRLNELEYVDGIIWANRWYDDHIYGIDSKTGCILAKVNLSSLRASVLATRRDQVTNGIAFNDEPKGLWVTGKYWSKRFLIQMPNTNSAHCS